MTQPIAKGFVPVLRYRDVAASADWLCRAFGFEIHQRLEAAQGKIICAQLRCGQGLVMLIPVGDSDLDSLMVQPDLASGLETQVCYVAVEDVTAHVARSVSAGAEVILDVAEDGGGGQGYTCRDLEGHVWTFGSYDPAAASARAEELTSPIARGPARAVGAAPMPDDASEAEPRSWKAGAVAAVLLASVLAGAGLVTALIGSRPGLSTQAPEAVARPVGTGAPGALEAALDARRSSDERAAAAAQELERLRAELASERAQKETALKSLRSAGTEIDAARSAATAAETAKREATLALENERALRTHAEELQRSLLNQLDDLAAEADRNASPPAASGVPVVSEAHVPPGAAAVASTQAKGVPSVAAAPSATAEPARPEPKATPAEPGRLSAAETAPAPASSAGPLPAAGPSPGETGSVEPAGSNAAPEQTKAPAAAETREEGKAAEPAPRKEKKAREKESKKERASQAPKPRPRKTEEAAEKQWPYSSW